MAGILANSVSQSMDAGDTSADNAVSGYLTRERIALTVTGTPDRVAWSLAKPTSSGSACDLSTPNDISTNFSPDVEGYYVISCVVDGATSYVLRVAVAQVTAVTTLTSIRLMPVSEASVSAPPTGATLFYSSDQDAVAAKLSDNSVVLL